MRLQLIRQGRGLSAKAMGVMLGVTSASIKQWEAGIRRPRNAYLEVYAPLAGVQVADVVEGNAAFAERIKQMLDARMREKGHGRTRLPSLASAPPRMRPCRTEAGCPVEKGWCAACGREVDNTLFPPELPRWMEIDWKERCDPLPERPPVRDWSMIEWSTPDEPDEDMDAEAQLAQKRP